MSTLAFKKWLNACNDIFVIIMMLIICTTILSLCIAIVVVGAIIWLTIAVFFSPVIFYFLSKYPVAL